MKHEDRRHEDRSQPVVGRRVRVGAHELFVNEAGPGHAHKLLLLHGSGPGVTALSNWERAMHDLSDRFHCIAPDMLGFADSSHPEPPPLGGDFMQARVDATAALLDALGLAQVDVVGNSMGGGVALRLAQQHPRRVRRLVLMGSALGHPRPTEGMKLLSTYYAEPTVERLTALLALFVHEPARWGDALRRIAEERVPRANREDVKRSHKATFGPGGPPEPPVDAAAITQPTLVIHGRDDRILALQESLDLLQALPRVEAHFFGQCGHWTQIERPAQFAALVRAFCGRPDDAA